MISLSRRLPRKTTVVCEDTRGHVGVCCPCCCPRMWWSPTSMWTCAASTTDWWLSDDVGGWGTILIGTAYVATWGHMESLGCAAAEGHERVSDSDVASGHVNFCSPCYHQSSLGSPWFEQLTEAILMSVGMGGMVPSLMGPQQGSSHLKVPGVDASRERLILPGAGVRPGLWNAHKMDLLFPFSFFFFFLAGWRWWQGKGERVKGYRMWWWWW